MAAGEKSVSEAAFGRVHGGDGDGGKSEIFSMRKADRGEDFVSGVMVFFTWIC